MMVQGKSEKNIGTFSKHENNQPEYLQTQETYQDKWRNDEQQNGTDTTYAGTLKKGPNTSPE